MTLYNIIGFIAAALAAIAIYMRCKERKKHLTMNNHEKSQNTNQDTFQQKSTDNDGEALATPNNIHPNIERDERLKRYRSFDNFQNNAKEIFEGLRDHDKRAEKYELQNMLCVCPGGRWGGTERSILNVFWGNKLYDLRYNDRVGPNRNKFLSESGAGLTFYRLPDGRVTIYINPARLDIPNPSTQEDTLILWKALDPSFLLSKWT